MYRDEVDRVLRIGDLEDEDGQERQQQKGEGKGGTTKTLSTSINVTRKDKKKLATTTAEKKNNSRKKPPPPKLPFCVCREHNEKNKKTGLHTDLHVTYD